MTHFDGTIRRPRLLALVNLAAFQANLSEADRHALMAWAQTTDTVAAGWWHVGECDCPASGAFAFGRSSKFGPASVLPYRGFAAAFDRLMECAEFHKAFLVIG